MNLSDPDDDGDGTEANPFDASYYTDPVAPLEEYQFDHRMRILRADTLNTYYIHLYPNEDPIEEPYLTQGIQLDPETEIGWRMGDGWTVAGAGIGATVIKLDAFTTFVGSSPKRWAIGTIAEPVKDLVVRDMTVDANWLGLENPLNGECAVLSVVLSSIGNATVENVLSINNYGDNASQHECFATT